ncbi:MAG: DUF928 domain-containing protein [Leptolyngbyaceae cyanobacterium]
MKISLSPLTAATTALLIGGLPLTAFAAPYVAPSDLGLPGPREGAGTRGCVFGDPSSLTLLMPDNNVGWTTAAYPEFHWYTPVNVASFVEFTLYKANPEDESDRTQVYQSRFAVSGEAGIASLQLPADSGLPPLELGQMYYWQVAIFCNPDSEAGDLQAGGWIERREPDAALAESLATASESEKVDLYAANGYWFDAVESLIAQRLADPEDVAVQAGWMELLESVGLPELVDQPLFSQGLTLDVAALDCLDLSALSDLAE